MRPVVGDDRLRLPPVPRLRKRLLDGDVVERKPLDLEGHLDWHRVLLERDAVGREVEVEPVLGRRVDGRDGAAAVAQLRQHLGLVEVGRDVVEKVDGVRRQRLGHYPSLSTLAATMKSLSESPPMSWVQRTSFTRFQWMWMSG